MWYSCLECKMEHVANIYLSHKAMLCCEYREWQKKHDHVIADVILCFLAVLINQHSGSKLCSNTA